MEARELSLLSHFQSSRNQEETAQQINQISNVLSAQYPALATLLPQSKPTQNELRQRVFTDLETRWRILRIPAHSPSDFALAHKTHTDEKQNLETERIRRVNKIVQMARNSRNDPTLNAEDLGYSAHRIPFIPSRFFSIKGEEGSTYGIYPDTGQRTISPLLYPDKITEDLISNSFIYLPSRNYLDLVATIKQLFLRGQALGFSRENYSTAFKLIIRKFFTEFGNIIASTTEPSAVFSGLITISKSYDVEQKLTNTLKNFKRKKSQSFPEFATLIFNLTSRLVELIFLSFNDQMVKSFTEERLIEHVKYFVNTDVFSVLENYKKSSIDGKYHSWEGITQEVFKIEVFLKTRIQEREIPDSFFQAVTTDRTCDTSLMLQTLQLTSPSTFNNPLRPTTPPPPPHSPRARTPSPNIRPHPGQRSQPHPGASSAPFSRSRPERGFQSAGPSRSRQPGRFSPARQHRQRSSSHPGERAGRTPSHPGERAGRTPSQGPHSSRAATPNNRPRTPPPWSKAPNRDRYTSPAQHSTAQHSTAQGRPRSRPTSRDSRSNSRDSTRSPHPTQRTRSPSPFNNRSYGSQSTEPAINPRKTCPYCLGGNCPVASCYQYSREEMSSYPCRLCSALHRSKACKN